MINSASLWFPGLGLPKVHYLKDQHESTGKGIRLTYNVQRESVLSERSSRKSRNCTTKAVSSDSHAILRVVFRCLVELTSDLFFSTQPVFPESPVGFTAVAKFGDVSEKHLEICPSIVFRDSATEGHENQLPSVIQSNVPCCSRTVMVCIDDLGIRVLHKLAGSLVTSDFSSCAVDVLVASSCGSDLSIKGEVFQQIGRDV